MEVGGGGGDYIYLSLHFHHQNDFCIKMGSEESHFNVSVGSDGQSHRSVHKPQPFWRERRAEADSNRGPSAYQPTALPLGQTGSHKPQQSENIDVVLVLVIFLLLADTANVFLLVLLVHSASQCKADVCQKRLFYNCDAVACAGSGGGGDGGGGNDGDDVLLRVRLVHDTT